MNAIKKLLANRIAFYKVSTVSSFVYPSFSHSEIFVRNSPISYDFCTFRKYCNYASLSKKTEVKNKKFLKQQLSHIFALSSFSSNHSFSFNLFSSKNCFCSSSISEITTHSSLLKKFKTFSKLAIYSILVFTAGYAFWEFYDSYTQYELNIPRINESIFEDNDNILVFFISKNQNAKIVKKNVVTLNKILQNSENEECKKVKIYCAFRPNKPIDNEEKEAKDENIIDGLIYKGQRRKVFRINFDELNTPKKNESKHNNNEVTSVKELTDFFLPLSDDISQEKHENDLDEERKNKSLFEKITYNNFNEKVIKESREKEKKILLQLFEDSCFLCFLMRPFIVSLSEILEENKIDLEIKKFNIEKNDFPDGMPICRGTPTFILYDKGAAEKLLEFKPKDLIAKLQDKYDLSVDALRKLNKLIELVHNRFQAFAMISFWIKETRKIERLLIGEADPYENEDEEDADEEYNEIITMLMEKDLRRQDNLEDNLEYLQNEIKKVEEDCYTFAQMLGEAIIAHENSDKISVE